MRGPIDSDAYAPRQSRDDGTITIGWAGSNATLAYFLELREAITEVSQRHPNVEVVVFGVSRPFAMPGVRVTVMPWSRDQEAGIIGSFDIGLSPMANQEWSRYRGGFKLIQYMACGAAIVASPLGIGDQVIRQGHNGFLATSPVEWRDAIERLVSDAHLRKAMAARGRQDAVGKYSYRAYLPTMLPILGVSDPEP